MCEAWTKSRAYLVGHRPRLRRTGERWWTLAATLVACAALVTTLVALLARELTWTWRPTIALAAVAHQLMWAAPVAVAMFALAARMLGAAVAAVVLLVAGSTQASIYIGGEAAVEGAPIEMLQANLAVGAADPAAFVRLVDQRRIDIATTEELTAAELSRLDAAGMSKLLPYRFAAPGPDATGLAIWSRYPLTQQTNCSGFDFGVLSARVVVAGRRVTVVAAHPVPPYPKPAGQWHDDLRRLRTILLALDAPATSLLVGGDFNATTDNAQFRALTAGEIDDAATSSGGGYLPTYPDDRWFGPLIAIDHVLGTRLAVTGLETVHMPGSDHRVLLASLAIDT